MDLHPEGVSEEFCDPCRVVYMGRMTRESALRFDPGYSLKALRAEFPINFLFHL